MKELCKISLNTLLNSLSGILIYFILGFLIDLDILSIFLTTYLLQYLGSFISCMNRNNMIWSNLQTDKDKANNLLISQMMLIIMVYLVFIALIILNLDWYIKIFTPLDSEIVKIYTTYSVFDILFNWVVWDLNRYYQFKNQVDTGNKMTILYVLTSNISIITFSLILNNKYIAVWLTIILKTIIATYYIIKFIYICINQRNLS